MHNCSKETEIELIKRDINYIREKIDDIHKKLVGNGQKGLITQMNELQGGLRFTQYIFAIVVAILTIINLVA